MKPLEPLERTVIGFLVLMFGTLFVILIAKSGCKTETVYPKQSTRECDSSYYWKSERLEWAIATADMIFESKGITGVAETIASETGRYPDSVLQEMNYSRKAEEAKQKRIKTGRIGKSYENQSVEE